MSNWTLWLIVWWCIWYLILLEWWGRTKKHERLDPLVAALMFLPAGLSPIIAIVIAVKKARTKDN